MSIESLFAFTVVTVENASTTAKKMLEEAKARIGYIPNIYSMMANRPRLLEAYTTGDSGFRKDSVFNAVEKEVVYLTVSVENNCRYCVAVHSTLADTLSKVPVETTNAIRAGKQPADKKLNALYLFTRSMVVNRGRPMDEEIQAFFLSGYTESHVLDIIHAISVKTLSNYSNHLFNTPVDSMFKAREWHGK